MLRQLAASAVALIALAGCDGEGPVALLRAGGELGFGACADPDVLLDRVRAAGAVRSSADPSIDAITLAPLEGFTATRSEIEQCVRLTGEEGSYLVVPNFATQGSSTSKLAFELTAAGVSVTLASGSVAGITADAAPEGDINYRQQRFDRMLREREREMRAPVRPSRGPVAPLFQTSPPPETRTFKVLASLTGSQFTTVTARLRYAGEDVLLYIDVDAPSGFSDQEVQEFGRLFDDPLYDITVDAFGSVSDIDNNGAIIVLLTPRVNALTEASDCATEGFVTGYFFGFDLASLSDDSNKAEIFYGLVPDPDAKFSCAHPVAQVKRIVSATFVHELQHMISFNQHVLVRNNQSEVVWLNEGLSHISEELASRFYETRFPPPLGRIDPAQLFPDSSQSFIGGNLFNAYNYLRETEEHSVTTFGSFGSLEERGAAWLFLRYLGDLKGDAIFGRLVQTSQTGLANVEAQAGEQFETLFGDFSIAIWTDSLPGVARSAIPERYRFKSRNLRQIYARLNQTGSTQRVYPVSLEPLSIGTPVNESMPNGTMDLFQLQADAASAFDLTLKPPATSPAFPQSLATQLSIFRLR